MASPWAYIDSSGVHSPTYPEVLNYFTTGYLGIWGSDIYLGDDSPDGQWVALVANAQHDGNQALVAAYQAFSPTFAQGVGLSAGVKINGLRRKIPTNSTATVTIVGVANTVISNGIVLDGNQVKWDLPASVTIPLSGTINVTATCQLSGAVAAGANTITSIFTQTVGWQSVTNAAAATSGAPVETDAALRRRQAASVAQPSQAIVGGIYAGIVNTSGVVRAKVYENATGSTDANGIPAHSIDAVVDGGTAAAVAQAIADRKPPGTQTSGATTQVVNDPEAQPITINFDTLSHVTASVSITLKALTGYVSTTGDAIKAAVAAFVSGLDIGEYSYGGRLFSPANLSGDAATTATGFTQAQLDVLAQTFNILSITQSRSGNPVDTTVTGGPYATGAVAAAVASTVDLYVGQRIRFILDNAANFDVTITSIAGSSVGFAAQPVPSSRNIPTGSNVYLLTDLRMTFKEAAQATAADVTLAVV